MDNILAIALGFLPLILILWLANLADRRREQAERHPLLAALTYILLASLYLAMVALGGFAHLLGSAAPLTAETLEGFAELGLGSDPRAILSAMGLALWLPSLAALILLLPPVRALLSRLLPIDPRRTVHAVALSYSMLIVSYLMLTLGTGLANMAAVLEGVPERSAGSLIAATWAQNVTFLFMAVVGVGWLSRRRLAAALRRLGIVLPTLRQLAVGLGAGLVMVPLALLLEWLAGLAGLGVDPNVGRLTEALIGPLFRSLPGILTLGLAAALGEEALFRGALQPRFGLLPTAALFALVHSNYGLTISTLIVLLLGLALGLLRQRANATTSMAAHATYNITLGLLAFLQLV